MNLTIEIARAASLLECRLSDRRAQWALNPTQMLVLAVLRRGHRTASASKALGTSVTDVADALRRSHATVSRQLTLLLKGEYVELMQAGDHLDQRYRRYRLTRVGLARANEIVHFLDDIDRLVRGITGYDAARLLQRQLREVANWLPEIPPLKLKGSGKALQMEQVRRRQAAKRAATAEDGNG